MVMVFPVLLHLWESHLPVIIASLFSMIGTDAHMYKGQLLVESRPIFGPEPGR